MSDRETTYTPVKWYGLFKSLEANGGEEFHGNKIVVTDWFSHVY